MTSTKVMANPWFEESANYGFEAENMLQRIESICILKNIIAIDVKWEFSAPNKLDKFIGEAKVYIGDSQEQIKDQFIKMNFDYIIDRRGYSGDEYLSGTVWLNDGSWITISIDSYDDYGDVYYSNYELNKLPIPPTRD